VTVRVDDVNDHSPVFIFPNSVNNTVHITSAAVSTSSRGHLLVAVCQASDADDGANARVTYEIANVSSTLSSDQFRIGRTSGRLTMRVGQTETVPGNMTFVIVVRARDDGWPPLSSTAVLHVVLVNTAMVYDGQYFDNGWSEAGTSSTHPKYRSDRM